MNTYNAFVTQVCRANTDFVITFEETVLQVIAKYASKSYAATVQYKDLLAQILYYSWKENQTVAAFSTSKAYS